MRGALLALLVAWLLAGCGGEDNPRADLRRVVERPPPPGEADLEPLPEPVEPRQVSFDPLERSPFAGLPQVGGGGGEAQADSGPHPDPDRPKEPLEQYALGSLTLVGTLKKPEGEWLAFVEAPDGLVHTVRVGNHLGQRHGGIEAIRAEAVELRELVPRGEGRWEAQRRILSLPSQASGG